MPDKRDSMVDWTRDPARARTLQNLRETLVYDEGTGRDDLVMITVEKILDMATEFGERCFARTHNAEANKVLYRIITGKEIVIETD